MRFELRRLPSYAVPVRLPPYPFWLLACAGCASEPRLPLAEVAIRLREPAVVPLGEGPLPVVELRLDGRDFSFLVDSGSTISVVDPRRAQELGLEVRAYRGSSNTIGSGGESIIIDRYVPVERLELGGLVLERTHVSALEDDVLRTVSCSGILGQDLLVRLPIVIDMSRRALHLLPPGTERAEIQAYLAAAQLGAGAWSVMETRFRPCPFLPLTISAAPEEPVEIEIDTGATDTSLPERLISVLELTEVERNPVELRAVGGSRHSKAYRLEDFELHGFRISCEIHSSALDYGLRA